MRHDLFGEEPEVGLGALHLLGGKLTWIEA
jgi:hypothetical protein